MERQNRFGWKSPAGIDPCSTSIPRRTACSLDGSLPDGRSTAAVVKEP
jgi:hypothetical protein